LNRGTYLLPAPGSEELREFVVGWRGQAGIKSVDAIKLLGPGKRLVPWIIKPVTHTGELLRFREVFLFSTQGFLSTFALGDIAKQQNNQQCLDQQKCGKPQDFPSVELPWGVLPVANFAFLGKFTF